MICGMQVYGYVMTYNAHICYDVRYESVVYICIITCSIRVHAYIMTYSVKVHIYIYYDVYCENIRIYYDAV